MIGLTALVVSLYLVIVVGLGRAPTHAEGTLLLLSIVAAAQARCSPSRRQRR